MKIFLNWMHRKLHPMGVVKYSQVPQKKGEEAEEIAEMVAAEEKEALLLHDMLGGILTIGTLGQYQNPFLPSEEASRFDEEEEHEEAPLIVAVEEKEEEEEEDKTTVTLKEQEIVLLQEDLPLLKEDLERRERARTTLADLFAADSAAREDANVNKGIKNTSNSGNKQSHKTKKKEEEKKTTTMQSPLRDTTKACCSNGKNSSSSSNSKLQKLMTRMLKKKIHPESITSAGAAAAKSIHTRDDVSRNGVAYW